MGGDEWRHAAVELPVGAPAEDRPDATAPEAAFPAEPPVPAGADGIGDVAGWQVSQKLPYERPEEFNRALLRELARGQQVVSLPLDAATRLGLDPDQARPEEVGNGALSLVTLDDLGCALRGVDLSALPLHVQAGSAALPVLTMLTAWQAECGQPVRALRGAVLSDPIAEWLIRGTLPGGLSRACDGMATLTKWAGKVNAPLRTVGVQADLWAHAGGSAVEELAFGLATGVEYLRALAERRVETDRAAPRFLFTFALDSWCFVEVAKLKAARLLWARAVEAMGGGPEARRLTCHGRVARESGTAAGVPARLLRMASETFAGMAGGCAVVHLEGAGQANGWLRQLRKNVGSSPDGAGRSCGATEPADAPCRIATLTPQLAEHAWALFQEVERMGGMTAAISAGFPQERVEKTAEQRRHAAESLRNGAGETEAADRERPADPAAGPPRNMTFALHRAREAATLRQGEGAARGREILARLGENARANARTKMAALVEAFACGVTLGEAARVLYQGGTPVPAIKPLRLSRR